MQSAVLQVTSCVQSLLEENASIIDLRSSLDALRSCSETTTFQSAADAEEAWRQACALWNTAVEATNNGLASSTRQAAVEFAWLRHIVCNLIHSIPAEHLQEFQQLQFIAFCLKASTTWTALDMWEQSDVVLTFAVKAAAVACALPLQHPTNIATDKAEQLCVQLFDVHVAHFLTAHKLGRQELASSALSAARTAAEELAPCAAVSSHLCVQLASALHSSATEVMLVSCSDKDHAAPPSQLVLETILGQLNTAYELLTRVKAQQRGATAGGADKSTHATDAAGRDSAPLLVQQLTQLECRVLLDLAYCHFNLLNDPAACLRCIDAFRQLETPEGWSHPAVSLVALMAFLSCDNMQQAEVEAAGIVVNDAADASTCLAVLLELLRAPQPMMDAIKSVLELVLGRFAEDPTIVPVFAQHALSMAATTGVASIDSSGNEINLRCSTAYAEALEQMVLQILDTHKESCAAVKADQGWTNHLHVVLYNYGVGRFDCKAFAVAEKFFTACLDYAQDSAKAGVCRVLVTCHLLLQHHKQATQYCKLAEGFQPQRVATSFLRFKLLLLQGDVDGILSEVQHMASCVDFSPSMLHLACQEALAANALPAARAALLKLLDILKDAKAKEQQHRRDGAEHGAAEHDKEKRDMDHAGNGRAGSSGICEGWVFRTLIKLGADELQKQVKLMETHKAKAASAADAGVEGKAYDVDPCSSGVLKETASQKCLQDQDQAKGTSAASSVEVSAAGLAAAASAVVKCAVQLSEVMVAAMSRLKVLGIAEFSGNQAAEGCKLVEWMSCIAWNAALHATGVEDHQPVVVLMHTSAELLSQLPALSSQQIKQQRLAYLVAAAAALDVHMMLPSHTASLKLAKKMCSAAKGVSSRALPMDASVLSVSDTGGPSEAFLLQLQFRIALYQQNISEQLALVEQLVEHPAVSADLMQRTAGEVHMHPHRCSEVEVALLEGLWRKLVSSSSTSGSPDWPKVAEVMRLLLQQSGSDDNKLRLYRESCSILTTLPKGTFPDLELSWLISTSWNTGLHHARFERHAEALQYMQVATSLLPYCTQGCSISSSQMEMMHKAKAAQEAAAAVRAV